MKTLCVTLCLFSSLIYSSNSFAAFERYPYPAAMTQRDARSDAAAIQKRTGNPVQVVKCPNLSGWWCFTIDRSRNLRTEQLEKDLKESREKAKKEREEAIANGSATCGYSYAPSEKLHDIVKTCLFETRFEEINPTNPDQQYLARLIKTCIETDVGCASSRNNSVEKEEEIAKKIISDVEKRRHEDDVEKVKFSVK